MDEKELSFAILECCKNGLYARFPALDGAFANLRPEALPEIRSFGTDGARLLFAPKYILEAFQKSPEALRKKYLHSLLHCLYLHPFRRKGKNPVLWDLACDIAVEQILSREFSETETGLRKTVLDQLGPISAEALYALLEKSPFFLGDLTAAFSVDSHAHWGASTAEGERTWKKVLSYTLHQQDRKVGTKTGSVSEKLESVSRGVRDYHQYLRQFSTMQEEMELDLDSFDPIAYSFGFQHYGNIPLVEPLEVREGYKLEELVIAIDTSGSCSKETVRSFLSETYGILKDRQNFFRKMCVYILQCDCMVQSVAVIHSQEEWKNYLRTLEIVGRGGTDFTPVFCYIAKVQAEGKLQKLKALLYFTDGDGVFPREKPNYETAFVFLHPSPQMDAVPNWAKVLLVEGNNEY